MDVLIRVAKPSDARVLADMNAAFNGVDTTAEQIREALEAGVRDEFTLIAALDGAVVGFACACVRRSVCYREPSGELAELYVKPEARRRGVGRALVREGERRMRDAGCGLISVRTNAANREARALYEAAGYDACDDVVYEKLQGGRG